MVYILVEEALPSKSPAKRRTSEFIVKKIIIKGYCKTVWRCLECLCKMIQDEFTYNHDNTSQDFIKGAFSSKIRYNPISTQAKGLAHRCTIFHRALLLNLYITYKYQPNCAIYMPSTCQQRWLVALLLCIFYRYCQIPPTHVILALLFHLFLGRYWVFSHICCFIICVNPWYIL